MNHNTMPQQEEKFVPNTTPIPNVILDVWIDRLSDVEFRILLVIARQTMGWIEDPKTGARKEKDWISQSQLVEKTGRSRRQISSATKVLVDELGIVQALNEKGKPLDSKKRQKNFGKIFYRLDLKLPLPTLFDKKTLRTSQFFREQKVHTEASREQILRTQKRNTTKENSITKKNIHNTLQSAPQIARENIKNKGERPLTPHKEFCAFWKSTAARTRGISPVIITGKDGANIKRVLGLGADQIELQKMALYFLADNSFRDFSPSVSTFLSSGVLSGLMNRLHNDPEFYRNLSEYQYRYLPTVSHETISEKGMSSLKSVMETILAKYKQTV